MVVDSVGRALKPVSRCVSATLIAYRGIDLWWVQGHCTRSSCLPTLASRQGPVNPGCGWAWAGIRVFRELLQGCSKAYRGLQLHAGGWLWVGCHAGSQSQHSILHKLCSDQHVELPEQRMTWANTPHASSSRRLTACTPWFNPLLSTKSLIVMTETM